MSVIIVGTEMVWALAGSWRADMLETRVRQLMCSHWPHLVVKDQYCVEMYLPEVLDVTDKHLLPEEGMSLTYDRLREGFHDESAARLDGLHECVPFCICIWSEGTLRDMLLKRIFRWPFPSSISSLRLKLLLVVIPWPKALSGGLSSRRRGLLSSASFIGQRSFHLLQAVALSREVGDRTGGADMYLGLFGLWLRSADRPDTWLCIAKISRNLSLGQHVLPADTFRSVQQIVT